MEAPSPNEQVVWSRTKRIAFRFAFVYLAFHVLQSFSGFPVFPLLSYYRRLWQVLVPWVGANVLGMPGGITNLTLGDTTYEYVWALCALVLAAATALIWSLLDRRSTNYERLNQGLRVAVRYAVLTSMVLYGTWKVIPAQFPGLSLARLLQPFGDASPMGLMWTFMNASASYTVFTGVVETMGGLLLIARRTTTLGALLCVGAMSNVFVMNMSYDVNVKVMTFHIILMSGWLLLPDLKRLVNVFLLNRVAEPDNQRPLFEPKWLHRGALALRTVFVVALLGYALNGAHTVRQQFEARKDQTPLYGIWLVEEHETDGTPRPPIMTDQARWHRVVFDNPQILEVQLMGGAFQRYGLTLDLEAKVMTLMKRPVAPNWQAELAAELTVERPQPNVLHIEGSLDGTHLRSRLRRQAIPRFLLTNRGFHWINEFPLLHPGTIEATRSR